MRNIISVLTLLLVCSVLPVSSQELPSRIFEKKTQELPSQSSMENFMENLVDEGYKISGFGNNNDIIEVKDNILLFADEPDPDGGEGGGSGVGGFVGSAPVKDGMLCLLLFSLVYGSSKIYFRKRQIK